MKLYIRGQDAAGAGWYEAPRTKGRKRYKHEGVDFMPPGDLGVVCALESGRVSKFGLPYKAGLGACSDLRYIQITVSSGDRHRYFYVDHAGLVSPGDRVEKGQAIGEMQGLRLAFGDITPHYHFEIMPKGKRHKIDPLPILKALGYECIQCD